MCFCLLPVTGLNLNFVFPEEDLDCKILDVFMIFVIFSKSYLCAKDWESAFGSIQQIWTIFKSCHCVFRLFLLN